MKYNLKGGSAYPLAEIELAKGETINLERGSMVYKQNVELTGKLNSNSKGLGGLLSSLGRAMTSGESMFITEAVGTAQSSLIGVAPANIGKIERLTVSNSKQYRLNTGAYLASDRNVSYSVVRQSVGKAFLSGTGGLFVMETSGVGDILISSFGDIIEMLITPNNPLIIDNGNVLAWDSSLDYSIKVASGTFGFTTGEGIVNEFRGSGKVLIQTRNIRDLAIAINPYITTSSN